MEQDLVLRGMAPRSRESYIGAVYGLSKHYGRRLDRLSVEEVQRYLYHLMEERKLAWSSCNVALSGLRFFYAVTLRWSPAKVNFMLPRRRGQWKLPQVLDSSEVIGNDQATLARPVGEQAEQDVAHVLSKWDGFLSHVKGLPSNARYNRPEGFNTDGYFKGATVATDIQGYAWE